MVYTISLGKAGKRVYTISPERVCTTEALDLRKKEGFHGGGVCFFFPLGIRNGGGKQGRGNQPPYRQYGPDTEIQYHPRKSHGLAKPSRILYKREAATECQYRPRIFNTDTIADAVLADAVSETSILG